MTDGPVHATEPQTRAAQRRDARVAVPRHQPRTDWRLGGRTVRRWREWLLASALVSLGVSILAGTVVTWAWTSPWAATSATALFWLGMLVPIVWAFARSIPAGLLRFRMLDLLYAVVLGGVLRVVQGWIETATGGSGALPAYPLVGGQLSSTWWFTDALAVMGIAPVLEEVFFRGVVLVALFTVLRRPLGRAAAGAVAVIASCGLFVLVHGLVIGVAAHEVVSLATLGLVCGLLVLLTGRIWAALLVHVVYNATFVALAVAGTALR